MSEKNAVEDQELAYPNMCSGLMIIVIVMMIMIIMKVIIISNYRMKLSIIWRIIQIKPG